MFRFVLLIGLLTVTFTYAQEMSPVERRDARIAELEARVEALEAAIAELRELLDLAANESPLTDRYAALNVVIPAGSTYFDERTLLAVGVTYVSTLYRYASINIAYPNGESQFIEEATSGQKWDFEAEDGKTYRLFFMDVRQTPSNIEPDQAVINIVEVQPEQ